MTENNKWKGHCACGAIKYESTEEPSLCFIVNADSAREQRVVVTPLYL
jgi:hypothetical protein